MFYGASSSRRRCSAFLFINVYLDQVEAYAAEKGLTIVGYYHANERLDDNELSAVAKKIADKIQSYLPPACVLLVSRVAPSSRVGEPPS